MIPFIPSILFNVIAAAVGRAVNEAAAAPSNDLKPSQSPALIRDVVAQVAADPALQELASRVAHATSTEAWYQSRSNWSAIVAGVTPLLAIAGYNLAPDDAAIVAGVLAVIGNGIAMYLARRARTASKPLGA